MALSNRNTAYPIAYEGSARNYAKAWCGNADHVGANHDGRDCPWHVDGDLKSVNTIDSAFSVEQDS